MPKLIYVNGSVRKDAVAIITKDCRVTEARVLETIYGGSWMPQTLRSVDVDEMPSPTDEAARMESLYGKEIVEKAYGHPASARQAIAEILALDTPQKVKASGLLVENDAVPLEVVDTAPPAKAKAA